MVPEDREHEKNSCTAKATYTEKAWKEEATREKADTEDCNGEFFVGQSPL